jgi:DNA-binding NtrC family response regulator
MVVQVLTEQGYHVLAAASGAHALELSEKADRPVDLLLTDMVMPGGVMGTELAERLSGKWPRLKVIYTSGYSPGMAGRDMEFLRFSNFIPKPYSVGQLSKAIRDCLDAPAKQD